jgi:phage terminase large subunit-like protein
LRIRKQHRPAVGGENANRNSPLAADQTIHLGACIVGPDFRHLNDISAMDLMSRHQGLNAKRTRRHVAIHLHKLWIIARTKPAIERGEDAGGMAAATGEKAMRKAGQFQVF